MIKNRDQFTRYMDSEQPLKPANVLNIVATNQGKRALTEATPAAKPLSAAQVKELIGAGHVVVDARPAAAFGAGSIPGAYNVQMASAEFEQRVGWVTPDNAPLILVTETAEAAQRCLYNMAFIALDTQVSGYLEGGVEAWTQAGEPVETIEQIDVRTLEQNLAAGGWQVLDVRSKDEWDEGHVEGAEWMPYTDMAPQLDTPSQLDKLTLAADRPTAVICGTGQRSSIAISLMRRHGIEQLFNVTGGMTAWQAAGLAMVDGSGRACEPVG